MIIHDNKKTSVRKRVSTLTTAVSFTLVFIIGLLILVSLLILRRNLIIVGGQLVDKAAEDSQNILDETVLYRMEVLAINRAAMFDALLLTEQRTVETIALRATDIMQNPGRYMANPVLPPDPEKAGVYSAQLIRAQTNVDLAAINNEVRLLGNIQSLLLSISKSLAQATYLASELGYEIAIDKNSDEKSEFMDPRERIWYIMAKANNTTIWTDFYFDVFGRGGNVTCAAPFYDANGNFAGAVSLDIFHDGLDQIIVNTMRGETGYSFLINQYNEVTFPENPNLLNVEAAALVENEKSGSSFLTTDDGTELIVAYAPLSTLPWTFVSILYVNDIVAGAYENVEKIIHMKDEADRRINHVIIFVIILLITTFVVLSLPIALVSRRFAHTLTKPITKLSDGVRLIADGNLDYSIDIRTGDEIEDLGVSVNKMAVGLKEYIFNLQKVTAEKERISAELDVAAKIQASMLPSIFPDRDEFDIYAGMQSAKEVGGDFYDFFIIDNNTLAVVIGDVSGKGVPAALFMVIAKTLIMNNAQQGKSPKEVFETVNRQLYENNKENMFVTAFIAYLDIPSGRFRFVNAGHNHPLIKRAGADFEWLSVKPGFVLAGLEHIVYTQHETTLGHGDILYLYTDGVTEAANSARELFGNPRLLSSVNTHKNLKPVDFLNHIKADIDIFAGGAEQADDMTMLVLEYK